MPYPPSPLLGLWLDQLGDRPWIDLSVEHVPRLLEAFTPQDFSLAVEPGSSLIRVSEHDVRLELSARLQPHGLVAYDATEPTQTGPLQRGFDTSTGVARHELMRLPLRWTGQGRGTGAVRSSVELYRALDMHTVRLNAVDDGRYAWAMCGFDFASNETRDYVVGRALDFASNSLHFDLDLDYIAHSWELAAVPGEVAMDEIRVAVGEEIELHDELADKLDVPMRLGKALLLFSDVSGWDGVLDISEGSVGYDILVGYTE